jgi:hypothetical protein
MRRNKSTFPPVCSVLCRGERSDHSTLSEVFVAISGQILQLFQMDQGIDKIARRSSICGNKRLFGLTYH